jgi:hypothetical protein
MLNTAIWQNQKANLAALMGQIHVWVRFADLSRLESTVAKMLKFLFL